MNPLRTLNIYYPALAEGVCPTLHPFLESYEVELVSESRGAETVIVCIDSEGLKRGGNYSPIKKGA